MNLTQARQDARYRETNMNRKPTTARSAQLSQGEQEGSCRQPVLSWSSLESAGKHEIHAWAMYVCMRQRETEGEGERTLILFRGCVVGHI